MWSEGHAGQKRTVSDPKVQAPPSVSTLLSTDPVDCESGLGDRELVLLTYVIPMQSALQRL